MQPPPTQNDVNEPETSAPDDAARRAGGFRVSDQPVVAAHHVAPSRDDCAGGGLPSSYGTDLLYVIARDPKSLFLYWDLNWKRLFAQAGLSPRQIHLRIYREDGSIEGTREINPFRGLCYVDVSLAGAVYHCELGCFDGDEWKSLARSGTTATPESGMSEDLSATFATLPIHLSFQRLLDIFRVNRADRKTLASSIAEMQENARVLQEKITPDEWSRLVAATAAPLKDGNEMNAHTAELATLLETARQAEPRTRPTAEQRAKWKELMERLGGSSWGGSSSPP